MSVILETWRTKKISLVAATEKIVTLDTIIYEGKSVIPNVIQVRNYNTTEILYVGIKSGVGSTDYIMSISPQNVSVHLSPGNYSTFYFLIAGNTNMDLNYAYDPSPLISDLDQTTVTNIINTTLTFASMAITSIAAGTNLIGKVGIDQLTANAHKVVVSEILAGTNLVGKFGIDQVTANANKVVVSEILDGIKILDTAGTNEL